MNKKKAIAASLLCAVVVMLGGLAASAASIEHIALEIKDPASMVKWWTENLGFKVNVKSEPRFIRSKYKRHLARANTLQKK